MTVIEILESVDAVIRDDHFVYTSGKHGEVYINKDALYPHTEQTSEVCKLFADHCKDMDIDTVIAPTLGGVILSQWTAYHLSHLKHKEVAGVYAEKMPDKSFAITRGYDKYVKGKKVLVLEDLTNTGGSVKKIVDLVKNEGGEVVAVGVMVNRDPEHVHSEMMGAPFFALGELKAMAYDEADLPERIKKRPVNVKVGHGKKYMEALKK